MDTSLPSKPPCTELLQIHECLRDEIRKLGSLFTEFSNSLACESLELLTNHFHLFFVIFKSHSRAEDEVILPALMKKDVVLSTNQDLQSEHRSQDGTFEQINALLQNLGADKNHESSQKSLEFIARVKQLGVLIESIRTSVWHHLKKEEDELFPLLAKNFNEVELSLLEGDILGQRSSEVVNLYLDMISRDLSSSDKKRVINSFRQAARGTRFANYLRYIGFDGTDEECTSISGDSRSNDHVDISPHVIRNHMGATPSVHICTSPGECCVDDNRNATETTFMGCRHYRRNCKLLFPCCNEFYCCRLCHDEAVMDFSTSKISFKSLIWHRADRYKVKEMWCQSCATQQSVNKTCVVCKLRMAKYVCLICNLFDDADNRPIYHCPYCNVCRVACGLGEDMFHCMKCNICITTKLKDHVCIEDAGDADCPICLGKLFMESEPIKRLQCGHTMHLKCYNSFLTSNYRCPMCRKSVCDMTVVWEKYDQIYSHRAKTLTLGAEEREITVFCNDCDRQTEAMRKFSMPGSLPEKCQKCGSYNTSIESVNNIIL